MLFDLLLGFIFMGLPFGIAGAIGWVYDSKMRKQPKRKVQQPTRFYDWEVEGL